MYFTEFQKVRRTLNLLRTNLGRTSWGNAFILQQKKKNIYIYIVSSCILVFFPPKQFVILLLWKFAVNFYNKLHSPLHSKYTAIIYYIYLISAISFTTFITVLHTVLKWTSKKEGVKPYPLNNSNSYLNEAIKIFLGGMYCHCSLLRNYVYNNIKYSVTIL